MADQDLALPVRTEDDLDQRVQVKIVDPTNPATQQATVDTDSNLHIEVHGNDSTGTDRTLALDTLGRVRAVVEDTTDGSAVNSYTTSASVAADASVNHDYTVTALKTLKLEQILASASGKIKVVVLTGASGGPTTRAVFFTSASDNNLLWTLTEPIDVVAGDIVRVTITNRDNQAQDVYSTIRGVEV